MCCFASHSKLYTCCSGVHSQKLACPFSKITSVCTSQDAGIRLRTGDFLLEVAEILLFCSAGRVPLLIYLILLNSHSLLLIWFHRYVIKLLKTLALTAENIRMKQYKVYQIRESQVGTKWLWPMHWLTISKILQEQKTISKDVSDCNFTDPQKHRKDSKIPFSY